MDYLQSKYSSTLISNNINDLLESIVSMRFNLKEEFEFMIFLRNYYLENKDKLNERIFEITTKIENVILREIERLGDFIYYIQKNLLFDLDNSVFRRYQITQGNYNKILVNIQKTIESSQLLVDLRDKFEDNKTFLQNKKKNYNIREKLFINTDNNNQISVLEDINNDIDQLKNGKKDKRFNTKSKRVSLSPTRTRKISNSPNKKIENSKRNRSKSPLTIKISEKKISFKKVKFIKKEFKSIKTFLDSIKNNINEQCICNKEKENYIQIQKQIIRAYSIIETAKENIVNLKNSLKQILDSLDNLEKENKKLRTDNNNLILYSKTKKIITCEGSEGCLDPSPMITDYSILMNSSYEMNINMKNNILDASCSKRIYIKK